MYINAVSSSFSLYALLLHSLLVRLLPAATDRNKISPEIRVSGTEITFHRRKKMKIVIKTLKGTRFEIQVKPEDSVADVKKNIETVLGANAYPAAEQKLIHKGKVLKDETTMEANNVTELSCIAVMKRKSASASANGKAQAQAHSSNPAVGIPGEFYYLPEGLPSNGSLDFLPYTEQYPLLRSIVQSNPRNIKSILEEIKKQNPPLFKLIGDNKDDFLRLIESVPFEVAGIRVNQMANSQELQADLVRLLNNEPYNRGDGGSPGRDPVEITEATFTREEDEFFEQMEAMGFDKTDVVQIYENCNMNVEVTANFLLDRIHEYQQRNPRNRRNGRNRWNQ